VLHHIEEQRRYLPAPEHRVAMRRLCRQLIRG
jgi:hypothetical protein